MNARTNPIFQDDFMAPLLGMESVPDILTLGTEDELLERGHSQIVCALWSDGRLIGSIATLNSQKQPQIPCRCALSG